MKKKRDLSNWEIPTKIQSNKELLQIATMIKEKTDYFVNDTLGKGGFSMVFSGLSQYEDDKNQYALKVVNYFDQTEKYVERERTINNKLKDLVFVVKFHAYISMSAKYKLFVLDKADYTLENLINQEKRKINGISELKVYFFFSQIVNAVSAMHDSNIVHRDLKPANILLLNYQIKICDFTTAKELKSSNQNEEIHTSLGTANFNSPEAFNPDLMYQKYLPATDIFSLGIIFYYLFYGCNPYKINEKDDEPDFKHLIDNINYNINNRKASDSFIDLFKQLVNLDLEKRITIKKIRNSPWFEEMKNKLKGIYPKSVTELYNFKECYEYIEKKKLG